MADYSWICDTLRSVASIFSRNPDQILTPDVVDGSIFSFELVYREFLVKDLEEGLNESETEASELVRRALCLLAEFNAIEESPRPPVVESGRAGRPMFNIPRSQLVYLVENYFTVPQIAGIIGVSVRTIFRRMEQYGISIRAQYAEITDDELDLMTRSIQSSFPMCGNRSMQGHLLSRGIRVQQIRVRESLRRIDPHGSFTRRLRTIRRRQYNVRAPRSLYHIDGNHKLIR